MAFSLYAVIVLWIVVSPQTAWKVRISQQIKQIIDMIYAVVQLLQGHRNEKLLISQRVRKLFIPCTSTFNLLAQWYSFSPLFINYIVISSDDNNLWFLVGRPSTGIQLITQMSSFWKSSIIHCETDSACCWWRHHGNRWIMGQSTQVQWLRRFYFSAVHHPAPCCFCCYFSHVCSWCFWAQISINSCLSCKWNHICIFCWWATFFYLFLIHAYPI